MVGKYFRGKGETKAYRAKMEVLGKREYSTTGARTIDTSRCDTLLGSIMILESMLTLQTFSTSIGRYSSSTEIFLLLILTVATVNTASWQKFLRSSSHHQFPPAVQSSFRRHWPGASSCG